MDLQTRKSSSKNGNLKFLIHNNVEIVEPKVIESKTSEGFEHPESTKWAQVMQEALNFMCACRLTIFNMISTKFSNRPAFKNGRNWSKFQTRLISLKLNDTSS